MAIIKADKVSICYMTGDFKDIGIKEYVMRRLKGNYHVKQFWADKDISFSLEKEICLVLSVRMELGSLLY